jgi:hypothetical protein
MELNLNNEEAKVNEDYYTKGVLEAGVDGVFRQNDKLFNEVKSGTWSQTFKTKNLDYKVGAEEGVRYVQYTQHNVEAIKTYCKERREFYQMIGTTDNPFFAGTFEAMNLPKSIAHSISSKYFNNRPWDLIKTDKKDKILFYAIVNEYYSDFVCHPSGKIPLPYNPAIPTK